MILLNTHNPGSELKPSDTALFTDFSKFALVGEWFLAYDIKTKRG